MKHFGDITKLDGYSLPPVDIITGGSPCQDLSVAGKRAGLAGERSGLFMEQIRIIKEMRENDRRAGRTGNLVRPRYMVWENVPGAFNSNRGEDFCAVLEETARIADEDAVIPRPPNGKWASSGCIVADGWSLAWRVHDAKDWGVPQRRKRVCLLADFTGDSAGRILFELRGKTIDGETDKIVANSSGKSRPEVQSFSNGLPRDFAESGAERQAVATDTKTSSREASTRIEGKCEPVISFDPSFSKNYCGIYFEDVAKTIQPGTAPGFHDAVAYRAEQPIMVEMTSTKNTVCEDGISPTITARMGTGGNQVNAVCFGRSSFATYSEGPKPLSYKGGDCGGGSENLAIQNAVVRRLTCLECERLQDFPDNWTNIGDWVDSKGKIHKGGADSPRYKALGNSIALPFWQWLACRVVPHIDHEPTMASLFDGIGGFPLVFSRAGCKPVWASEIEEFPIAVTKIHFPEEEEKDND